MGKTTVGVEYYGQLYGEKRGFDCEGRKPGFTRGQIKITRFPKPLKGEG